MSDEGARSWEFTRPGHFTAGAVGEPGSRVFYFQAFADGVEVEVKCEKQQVVALADQVVKLLDDMPTEGGRPTGETDAVTALPPSDLAWVVGSISIGIDRSEGRVVLLFEEIVVDESDGTVSTGPGSLRVHLTVEQVAGFVAQARTLVAESRPLCRLCGRPMDPTGHACPRLN